MKASLFIIVPVFFIGMAFFLIHNEGFIQSDDAAKIKILELSTKFLSKDEIGPLAKTKVLPGARILADITKSQNDVAQANINSNTSNPESSQQEMPSAQQETLSNPQDMPSTQQGIPAAGSPNAQLEPSPPEEAQPQEEYRVILTPLYRATLSSEVVVTTVLVINKRMGNSFVKGDLLVKLDDTVFKGLLIKAKGLYAKAQISLKAKQELFADNIASYFDIATAESDLASAESDMISAQHAINQCTILAPYDGQVTNVYVEEHELVQQGKPLMEIINDSVLIGRMLIPSSLFNQVRIGQTLKINVRDANATVTGKILRIDSAIDPASSMFKVDVEIENQNRELRPGMIGTTQLRLNERQ